MPEFDSEAFDFRAASELFAPVLKLKLKLKLKRTELDTLRPLIARGGVFSR